MICEACGNIISPATGETIDIEGAAICPACAPDFHQALDAARQGGSRGRARDAHAVARSLLRERGGMTQLVLRDVPVPVARAFKARAAAQGVTVRELFLDAAGAWLTREA